MTTLYQFNNTTFNNITQTFGPHSITTTNIAQLRIKVDITSLAIGAELRATAVYTHTNGKTGTHSAIFRNLGVSEFSLWHTHNTDEPECSVTVTLEAVGRVQMSGIIQTFSLGEDVV